MYPVFFGIVAIKPCHCELANLGMRGIRRVYDSAILTINLKTTIFTGLLLLDLHILVVPRLDIWPQVTM